LEPVEQSDPSSNGSSSLDGAGTIDSFADVGSKGSTNLVAWPVEHSSSETFYLQN
jgi:hypothetical protein